MKRSSISFILQSSLPNYVKFCWMKKQIQTKSKLFKNIKSTKMNVTKKLLLLGFFMFALNAYAQNINFGLKAGLVFNADKGAITALNGVIDEKGKGSVGFQGGAMVRIKAGGLYVQPELLYTAFKNEYKEEGYDVDVKKSRLDIPINVGKTFAMGLVQVQTGPVFSLNFEDTINSDGINI